MGDDFRPAYLDVYRRILDEQRKINITDRFKMAATKQGDARALGRRSGEGVVESTDAPSRLGEHITVGQYLKPELHDLLDGMAVPIEKSSDPVWPCLACWYEWKIGQEVERAHR